MSERDDEVERIVETLVLYLSQQGNAIAYDDEVDAIRKAVEAGGALGARRMQEKCAAIADGADTLVGRTYQPDHPRVAQRVARAIRALKPEDV